MRSLGGRAPIRGAAAVRKPGMNFDWMHVSLCAALVLVAAPVRAAAPNFGVEARAVTGGTPGSGATYVGPLIGEVEADAEHDPPALQWLHNYTQQLFSDAAAWASADAGALETHVYALARRVQATNFPAAVTATGYARYTDRVLVVSDTLAKNTPVTLTFRAAVTVDWSGAGLYDGRVGCRVEVGVGSAYAQWIVANDKDAPTVGSPTFVVKTTVGATLGVSGRLDSAARTPFMVPGPRYDGELEISASCDAQLIATSADVRLVSESGVDDLALAGA